MLINKRLYIDKNYEGMIKQYYEDDSQLVILTEKDGGYETLIQLTTWADCFLSKKGLIINTYIV